MPGIAQMWNRGHRRIGHKALRELKRKYQYMQGPRPVEE
jgi:hypothetical protein